MALSTNTYTYTGGAQTFAVNFALGFIQRSDVNVRINNAVDGSGDPAYASIDWIDDSAVIVLDVLTIGDTVEVLRTVSKSELKVSFTAGADITPSNLDLSALQGLMVYQELVDGRVEGKESPLIAANRAEAGALASAAFAAAALVSENAAAADSLLTNANAVSTAADLFQTNIDQLTVAADAAQVAIDKATVAANLALTDADTVATAADRAAVADDAASTAADRAAVEGITADALFESELASPAAVKATTGTFLVADEAKLDGIEALADITDTANVTDAGALMDSEITSIASVKALDQGVATTDSPTFAGLTVDAGTINTTATFHSTDTTASLYLTDGSTTGGSSGVQGLITSGDNIQLRGLNKVELATGTTTYMTVASGGNVGIRDANPAEALSVTGNIAATGTVDGRDVATDGTKLDGIEALADVTDVTNVTAAGALMDSEVTNLAQVKAFSSADYATAAQGTTADAALPKAGGAMTGAITTTSTFDGRDVSVDGAKLDGIEALADVTDATNVAAAGALMDSELNDIAAVKALYTSYDTPALLLASIEATRGTGAIWEAGGFRYIEVVSGGDITTAGSIQLDVIQGANGYNVQAFGALADGADTGTAFTGTDNTAVFQAALDAAGTAGAVLHIPAGKYRFAANTVNNTSNLTLNNSTHIIDGYGAELLIDDDAGTHYSLLDFIRTVNLDTSTALDDRDLLQINGVTFQGRWSHNNYYAGSNVLTVQNFARIELNDVKAYDIPAKFSRSRYCGALVVTGFEAKRIASDCLRFVDTPDVTITNINLFEIDDDCIALPISNAGLAHPRSRITISNATIEKCEGILILGARSVAISNVAMSLCMGTHIYVGGKVGTEGVSPVHGITLSNITVTDPLNRASGGSIGVAPTAMLTSSEGVIIVAGSTPNSATTAVWPERYDSVTGTFVTPYQLDTNLNPIMYNESASNTLTGGYNVSITNCSVMRTLPAVTNYSDWGLGLAFNRYGRYDPAVSLANWTTNGVQLNGFCKNVVIADCTIMGLQKAGVYLRSLAGNGAERQREFENILISGVTVRDCLYGITHSATATATAFTWDVAIRDCSFDLDPYHTHAERNAPLDGGWQAGATVFARPVGVFFRTAYGWSIHGCSFANCYDPILANSSFLEQADVKDNILRCEPAGTGHSITNLGIGLVPTGGEGFRHFIVDCDPTSANYMEYITIPVSESSTVPTAGKYVRGHVVKNSNPTTAISKTTLGWVRQTTGVGHTVATIATADWAPLVIPTS